MTKKKEKETKNLKGADYNMEEKTFEAIQKANENIRTTNIKRERICGSKSKNQGFSNGLSNGEHRNRNDKG